MCFHTDGKVSKCNVCNMLGPKIWKMCSFFLELSIVLLCAAVSPHRPHLTWRTWRGSSHCVELEKMWPSGP